MWACDDPSQIATTEESSAILAEKGLAEPITGRGVCLPTDHAGLLAVVDVSAGPPGAVAQPAPPDHSSFRIDLLGWIMIILGRAAADPHPDHLGHLPARDPGPTPAAQGRGSGRRRPGLTCRFDESRIVVR